MSLGSNQFACSCLNYYVVSSRKAIKSRKTGGYSKGGREQSIQGKVFFKRNPHDITERSCGEVLFLQVKCKHTIFVYQGKLYSAHWESIPFSREKNMAFEEGNKLEN